MYVPIPGCPFTCTIIQPFLYDHLERNKGYVDLYRNVKVTFVPLVFLQIETDIIGSMLFSIWRSLVILIRGHCESY